MPFYKGAAKQLANSDFGDLANKFGIEEALIRTVNEVESRGRGYTNGMVTALYEPHIAYKYSSGDVRSKLVRSGLAYKSWVKGNYPKTSYARIDAAAKIAGEELAALSTSWGMGQIMGFNHSKAGYGSAVAMVKAFANSEAEQLEGMLNFIKSSSRMMNALKKKDFDTFAYLYNGSGYKQNKYDQKLESAYAKFTGNAPTGLTITVSDEEDVYWEEPYRESIWTKILRAATDFLKRRRS